MTVDDWVEILAADDGPQAASHLAYPVLTDLAACLEARQQPVDHAACLDMFAALAKMVRRDPYRVWQAAVVLSSVLAIPLDH